MSNCNNNIFIMRIIQYSVNTMTIMIYEFVISQKGIYRIDESPYVK